MKSDAEWWALTFRPPIHSCYAGYIRMKENICS